MKCKDLKFELQHYADGELSETRSAAVAAHMDSCPVCRDELARIGALRAAMRALARPSFSAANLQRLKKLVAAELRPAFGFPTFRLIEGNPNWLKNWLMPTAVGTFASLLFGLILVTVIMIPSYVPNLAIETETSTSNYDPLLLANFEGPITPQQFANSRANIAEESPSINPDGTLVAMTDSTSRGEMRDDEMVVVAEVFSNGEARITDVVERPSDRKTMDRLQAAFTHDRSGTPFVPARLDNRSEIVRVVLKFQSVNVSIDDGTFR